MVTLAQSEVSLAAQRRFITNASHELRTRLALDRARLELALSDPGANLRSLRATCEKLLASAQDHERLLEALLTLARTESELDCREPLDLATLARDVVRAPRALTGMRFIQLATALAPAPTTGNPVLIGRLIANLIDNASQYNDFRGHVRVRTATAAMHSMLTVSNTGPLLSPGELDRLFEPFKRRERESSGTANNHHGLGLSIVRAIATAHGASVAAQPRPSGGLVVTVRFAGPRAPTEI